MGPPKLSGQCRGHRFDSGTVHNLGNLRVRRSRRARVKKRGLGRLCFLPIPFFYHSCCFFCRHPRSFSLLLFPLSRRPSENNRPIQILDSRSRGNNREGRGKDNPFLSLPRFSFPLPSPLFFCHPRGSGGL